MAQQNAKSRLEAVARHLTIDKTGERNDYAPFELEDHPVDVVRELRVSYTQVLRH